MKKLPCQIKGAVGVGTKKSATVGVGTKKSATVGAGFVSKLRFAFLGSHRNAGVGFVGHGPNLSVVVTY